MTFFNSPKKILFFLFKSFLLLLVFNIVGIIAKLNFDNGISYHLYNATSFDSETSLATFYSSLLLLLAAALLYFIYYYTKGSTNKNISWLLLSIIFLYLSIDESVAIHEKFMLLIREEYNLSGFLYFSWVIPYGILLIIFSIYLIPFLLKLESKTRNLFIISGVVFVFGALGIELFEGKHFEIHGKDMVFEILYTIEESFEILGVSLFIYALLRYISIKIETINIIGETESLRKN